jgi:hypothetical protein
MPDKYSDARIKKKAVGFGQQPRLLHNRYTRTGTCFRWAMAVAHGRYKCVTVSLLKRLRLRSGRFNYKTAVRHDSFRSETAIWIQKWFKTPFGGCPGGVLRGVLISTRFSTRFR